MVLVMKVKGMKMGIVDNLLLIGVKIIQNLTKNVTINNININKYKLYVRYF